MKLYIYTVSQDVNSGYDTYDSMVVIAPDEETARNLCPCSEISISNAWATPQYVTVCKIGIAVKTETQRIVCASYNAG